MSKAMPGVDVISDHDLAGGGAMRIPRTANAKSAKRPYRAAAVAWVVNFMTTNVHAHRRAPMTVDQARSSRARPGGGVVWVHR